MTDGRWGAYGIHLDPCPSTRWLVPAPADWPTVTVSDSEYDVGAPVPTRVRSDGVVAAVDGRRVQVEVETVWQLRVDLEEATATYRGVALDSPEFVHPSLAAAAAMFSRSWGRGAFHAGGVVLGEAAWGVVGDREAGKTTLLARLAARSLPVVADDLLVLHDGSVLTGPRCLDLREPAARTVSVRVRDGHRDRVTLAPMAPSTPFGGWVFLRWGDELSLDPVGARDRLRVLADAASWVVESQDPVRLLDAMSWPAWWLTRPRDAALLDPTADLLVSRLGRG